MKKSYGKNATAQLKGNSHHRTKGFHDQGRPTNEARNKMEQQKQTERQKNTSFLKVYNLLLHTFFREFNLYICTPQSKIHCH